MPKGPFYKKYKDMHQPFLKDPCVSKSTLVEVLQAVQHIAGLDEYVPFGMLPPNLSRAPELYDRYSKAEKEKAEQLLACEMAKRDKAKHKAARPGPGSPAPNNVPPCSTVSAKHNNPTSTSNSGRGGPPPPALPAPMRAPMHESSPEEDMSPGPRRSKRRKQPPKNTCIIKSSAESEHEPMQGVLPTTDQAIEGDDEQGMDIDGAPSSSAAHPPSSTELTDVAEALSAAVEAMKAVFEVGLGQAGVEEEEFTQGFKRKLTKDKGRWAKFIDPEKVIRQYIEGSGRHASSKFIKDMGVLYDTACEVSQPGAACFEVRVPLRNLHRMLHEPLSDGLLLDSLVAIPANLWWTYKMHRMTGLGILLTWTTVLPLGLRARSECLTLAALCCYLLNALNSRPNTFNQWHQLARVLHPV
ncbi:hypothetical protein BOTBODRAFT_181012 [Botryobasidium botryosum FD-172 SS1]|uniref:Uncharacterized protein n=1 Tax=Botryobasidium botryosum (strain FD-172 SS1) TaxID=930990 RepID=A0A067M577_BOTB1|nr:hypothetical protein BOTBODRAFT_181012 [Botryobasidium botryosum FD-172 SS1]